MTEPKQPLDGCPRCLTRDHEPTATTEADGRLTATYACDCGHTWHTCWAARALPDPEPAGWWIEPTP